MLGLVRYLEEAGFSSAETMGVLNVDRRELGKLLNREAVEEAKEFATITAGERFVATGKSKGDEE